LDNIEELLLLDIIGLTSPDFSRIERTDLMRSAIY